MENRAKRQRDPTTHQPSKAELEEDVSVDATPEALGVGRYSWGRRAAQWHHRFGAQRACRTERKYVCRSP